MAQETSEKRNRRARTPRATQPVCSRMFRRSAAKKNVSRAEMVPSQFNLNSCLHFERSTRIQTGKGKINQICRSCAPSHGARIAGFFGCGFATIRLVFSLRGTPSLHVVLFCAFHAMDFLSALWLSLLPPFYRRTLQRHAGSHLIRGAIVTAILEIVLAAVFYAKGFMEYAIDAYMPPVAFLEYFFTGSGLCFAAMF